MSCASDSPPGVPGVVVLGLRFEPVQFRLTEPELCNFPQSEPSEECSFHGKVVEVSPSCGRLVVDEPCTAVLNGGIGRFIGARFGCGGKESKLGLAKSMGGWISMDEVLVCSKAG